MALTKTEHSEITESQVLALLGSVSYQDGSVVSRVILKRDKGSVTAFAFDEEQGLSEPTSPFEALVQGIEGRGEVIIAGQPLTWDEGESLLFPVPEATCSESNFTIQDDAHHDPAVVQTLLFWLRSQKSPFLEEINSPNSL